MDDQTPILSRLFDPLDPYHASTPEELEQLEIFRQRQLRYDRAFAAYAQSIGQMIRAIVAFVEHPGDASRQLLHYAEGAMVMARQELDSAQFDRVISGVTAHQLASLISGDVERDLGQLRRVVEQLQLSKDVET